MTIEIKPVVLQVLFFCGLIQLVTDVLQVEVNIRKELNEPQGSSTPGNGCKKIKRPRIVHPDQMADLEVKRADLEAAQAIKLAADKIMDAAVLISNCVKELKPELKSLANRNYRKVQMSCNAIRQLVRNSKVSFLS